ncbi:hypothetical protein GALL_475240 [mine drainage metagenome]|uniref:Uncharacterized protein n=1 Tax=mine drainage metagenome TaxID=410659 RepID=A0A1J5Q031_9ZZZZ
MRHLAHRIERPGIDGPTFPTTRNDRDPITHRNRIAELFQLRERERLHAHAARRVPNENALLPLAHAHIPVEPRTPRLHRLLHQVEHRRRLFQSSRDLRNRRHDRRRNGRTRTNARSNFRRPCVNLGRKATIEKPRHRPGRPHAHHKRNRQAEAKQAIAQERRPLVLVIARLNRRRDVRFIDAKIPLVIGANLLRHLPVFVRPDRLIDRRRVPIFGTERGELHEQGFTLDTPPPKRVHIAHILAEKQHIDAVVTVLRNPLHKLGMQLRRSAPIVLDFIEHDQRILGNKPPELRHLL